MTDINIAFNYEQDPVAYYATFSVAFGDNRRKWSNDVII